MFSQLFFANWYKREELAQRVSYLFIASALSGAFGGLIAFAILYMDGTAGYPGWRWLYIIEGLITLVWAGCCIYLVPKDYQTAYFLTEEDRKIMAWRYEASRAYSGGTGHYGKKDFKAGAGDIKTWAHAVVQIMVVTILYGMSTTLVCRSRVTDIPIQQASEHSCQSSYVMASTSRSSKHNTSSSPLTSGAPSSTLSAHTCPTSTKPASGCWSSWHPSAWPAMPSC